LSWPSTICCFKALSKQKFQFLFGGFYTNGETDGKNLIVLLRYNLTKTFVVRMEYFNIDSKNLNVNEPFQITTIYFLLCFDLIKSWKPLFLKMVWEGSYKLGCGIEVCPNDTLVVCQYSPPQDEALCIKPNEPDRNCCCDCL
uniref:SCP domain-containing protein n=1 Tax=Angiostrongylus cantonensis TaxID=6313 RepID=A0A0K0CZP1_ANGCA